MTFEYIDGTKIESKANKYTFVLEENRAKLQEQIRTLLLQVDDVIAQDNAAKTEGVEFTAALLDEISDELNKSLESVPEPKTKEEKQAVRTKKKQLKELEKKRNKLQEYDQHLEIYPGLVCPFRIASSFNVHKRGHQGSVLL